MRIACRKVFGWLWMKTARGVCVVGCLLLAFSVIIHMPEGVLQATPLVLGTFRVTSLFLGGELLE